MYFDRVHVARDEGSVTLCDALAPSSPMTAGSVSQGKVVRDALDEMSLNVWS